MQIDDIIASQNPWWARPEPGPPVQPFRRDLQVQLLKRVQAVEDRRAHLVLGPRQVGKTELLKQLVVDLIALGWPRANVTYFRFDDERVVQEVSAEDVARIEPLGTSPEWPRVLLLDEIRKVSRWDLWLKRRIDAGRGERIVVTDSAAGLLRRGSVESGPGRWDEHRLGGLTLVEFLRIWDGDTPARREHPSPQQLLGRYPQALENYLLKGGFPEHVAADPRLVPERLRGDIVDRAIRRDFAELDIDVEEARRLFVLLVQDSGAIHVTEHRATDLGRDPRTIQEYTTLFEDAQLLMRLEERPRARTGKLAKAKRRLRTRKKLYAADHGLVTAFAALPEPWSDEDVRARVFEAVVFSHLRTARAGFAFEGPWFVNHGDEGEIDFWLETERGPLALEVTSSPRYGKKVGAFVELARSLGARASLLVHGGVTDESSPGLRAVPLPTFLLDPVGVLRSIQS